MRLRIAKAIKTGHYNKAKALQWILTHSFYAKIAKVYQRKQMKVNSRVTKSGL